MGSAVTGTRRVDGAPRGCGSSITTGTLTGSEATVDPRIWLCSAVLTTSRWRDKTTVGVVGLRSLGQARTNKPTKETIERHGQSPRTAHMASTPYQAAESSTRTRVAPSIHPERLLRALL